MGHTGKDGPRVVGVLLLTAMIAGRPATSAADGQDGFVRTGLFVARAGDGKPQYTIVHEIRRGPVVSRGSLVEANIEKRYLISTARELPCSMFSERFASVLQAKGSPRDARMVRDICTVPVIPARSRIVIVYVAGSGKTTVSVEGMGTFQATGESAMRAIWGVFLGEGATVAERTALAARR